MGALILVTILYLQFHDSYLHIVTSFNGSNPVCLTTVVKSMHFKRAFLWWNHHLETSNTPRWILNYMCPNRCLYVTYLVYIHSKYMMGKLPYPCRYGYHSPHPPRDRKVNKFCSTIMSGVEAIDTTLYWRHVSTLSVHHVVQLNLIQWKLCTFTTKRLLLQYDAKRVSFPSYHIITSALCLRDAELYIVSPLPWSIVNGYI